MRIPRLCSHSGERLLKAWCNEVPNGPREKPKVNGLNGGKQKASKKSASDPGNPPELVAKSKGERHDYLSTLGL
jgi:hypothetical protein